MPKYEIREVRQVSYTIDVPDGSGITPNDIATVKLDSRNWLIAIFAGFPVGRPTARPFLSFFGP